jgi:hypothetical protein
MTSMSDAHDQPTLDDVLVPEEDVHPNRREHGKADPHPDEDQLERRVEHERAEVGLDPLTDEPTDQPTDRPEPG